MATNMDKALYEAPMGVAGLAEDDDPEAIEVILDDEMVDPQEMLEKEEEKFEQNLAEKLDDEVLKRLADDLVGDFESDCRDRNEWLETYNKGLELLGLKIEEKTEPWSGACGVFHPMLMEAAIKFQSETIMETFPAAGPVRTKIIGKETPEKKDAAKRVEADMNYELTERMPDYRPEHERMLIALCLSGNAFKKVYYDPSLERQTAMFISAEDLVVPYGASTLGTAERVTHRMRKTKNEVLKLQEAKFYRDVDLGEPQVVPDADETARARTQGFSVSSDTRFQLLEMHVELDLDYYKADSTATYKDKVAEPYVVTIDRGTRTVLAIRRNWRPDDEQKRKREHFVHYGYIPGFGFYYFGLVHLIGGHAKAATSLLRQLVDAGTLSNLPGGFKTRGMKIKEDDTPIEPAEFRDVDVPSGTLKDNILPLPYKEPSQTLSLLMDKIVEDARRYAGAADLQISDMSGQAPVGTTLAILERTLKVMSAVQARIHYAMKQEFQLLAAIIRDNTPDEYGYEPDEGEPGAKKSDYEMVDVLPVSDPNSTTMSQRVVQYQAALELSKTAPQIYNQPLLHREMLEVLGLKNASKIVQVPEDMQPIDPVSENMNILMGKPVKAFMIQDHEAHLAVHMTAMQDPKIAEIVGQNPNAPALMAAAHAHIMEHVAFQYRREIEKQLGGALPPMPTDDGENLLPPQVENQLSQLAAAAASKLLQKDIMEHQAQQAAAAAQDPLMALQQADIEIKKGELERKKQKDVVDAAAKADELDLKRTVAQADVEQKRLDTLVKVGQAVDQNDAQEKDKKAQRDHDAFLTGADHAHQRRMQQEKPQPEAKPKAKKEGKSK